MAITGISYATSLALNQRKRREEDAARKAAAAKQFNARQRALEKKRAQKIAYYRRLRDAAAALYTAGVITAAALFSMSAPAESNKARLESCVNMGGYTKCYQVSPSPIMYANMACRGWEQLDFCDGDPDNFPRDETINDLANASIPLLTHNIIAGVREIPDSYVDPHLLRQNIAILLVASQEYGLDREETAYVLGTALGESKFGAITDGYYADNKERSPMWEVTDREDAELMYGKDTDEGKALGNDEEWDGYRYRGRGFCQLTGKDNYDDFDEIFSVDYFGEQLDLQPEERIGILNTPDVVAENPRLSAEITVYGMVNGGLGTLDRGENAEGARYVDAYFESVREFYGCSGTDCFYPYRDIINRNTDRTNHHLYELRAYGLYSELEE